MPIRVDMNLLIYLINACDFGLLRETTHSISTIKFTGIQRINLMRYNTRETIKKLCFSEQKNFPKCCFFQKLYIFKLYSDIVQ